MNSMRISIIIPAFNEERLLAASLAEIRTAAMAAVADLHASSHRCWRRCEGTRNGWAQ